MKEMTLSRLMQLYIIGCCYHCKTRGVKEGLAAHPARALLPHRAERGGVRPQEPPSSRWR
eukprot:750230-Hanusia_phi.AAC.1